MCVKSGSALSSVICGRLMKFGERALQMLDDNVFGIAAVSNGAQNYILAAIG